MDRFHIGAHGYDRVDVAGYDYGSSPPPWEEVNDYIKTPGFLFFQEGFLEKRKNVWYRPAAMAKGCWRTSIGCTWKKANYLAHSDQKTPRHSLVIRQYVFSGRDAHSSMSTIGLRCVADGRLRYSQFRRRHAEFLLRNCKQKSKAWWSCHFLDRPVNLPALLLISLLRAFLHPGVNPQPGLSFRWR